MPFEGGHAIHNIPKSMLNILEKVLMFSPNTSCKILLKFQLILRMSDGGMTQNWWI